MNDRCAGCFELLAVSPYGGRYACLSCPTKDYWSEAIPESGQLKDVRLVSKHGRLALYFYGATP